METKIILHMILALLDVAFVAGHGELVYPRSRNAIDWEQVNCDVGDTCNSAAKGTGCINFTHPNEPCRNGQSSFWYSQGCFIGCEECDHISGRSQADICGSGKQATLPNYARSVNLNATPGSIYDIYKHNPWRAPGNAPVASACGLAGGSPFGHDGAEAGNYMNTTHAGHGHNGSSLPAAPTGTVWKIGGEAEVSWQVRNNHGGGYAYRLCPAEEELTEACFQRHPLDMVPEKAQLQFTDGSRKSYAPVTVTTGTQPAGSMWARIPVAPTKLGPMCVPGRGDDPKAPYACGRENDPKSACGCAPCPRTPGSDCSRCDNCDAPSWQPLATYPADVPKYGGKGVAGVGSAHGDGFVGIVDVLKIPADLPAGKYVLGWRYDCEATAQVWSNCADIELSHDAP